MTRILSLGTLLLAGLLLASSGAENSATEWTVQSAAENWLRLIDAGKSDESWDALATPTRANISHWRWKLGFWVTQKQFGSFIERKLRSARFSTRSPSGHAGEYVFLEFNSKSSRKDTVIETLATIHEPDGQWRGVTYTVQ